MSWLIIVLLYVREITDAFNLLVFIAVLYRITYLSPDCIRTCNAADDKIFS